MITLLPWAPYWRCNTQSRTYVDLRPLIFSLTTDLNCFQKMNGTLPSQTTVAYYNLLESFIWWRFLLLLLLLFLLFPTHIDGIVFISEWGVAQPMPHYDLHLVVFSAIGSVVPAIAVFSWLVIAVVVKTTHRNKKYESLNNYVRKALRTC